MSERTRAARIWAVGGGKGGTGKSIFSCLTAIRLARSGKRVVLLDLDLGAANQHSLLGMKQPTRTLQDFVDKQVAELSELELETGVPGLTLVSGASDLLSLANPKYGQKTRLINAIRRVSADVVLLDLGAGVHFNTIDFALLADQSIVVVTPQMTAIENAYGYIKGMLYRQLERELGEAEPLWDHLKAALKPEPGQVAKHLADCLAAAREVIPAEVQPLVKILEGFRPRIVVNQLGGGRDAMAGEVVGTVAHRFLGVTANYVGAVPVDGGLRRSIDSMWAMQQLSDNCPAVAAVQKVVNRLLAEPEVEMEAAA